jgi:hypothetical protein
MMERKVTPYYRIAVQGVSISYASYPKIVQLVYLSYRSSTAADTRVVSPYFEDYLMSIG